MSQHQDKNPPKKDEFGRYDREELLFYYLALSPEERSKEFLTPAGTAEWLEKSERTIRDWVRYDWVAAIKIGGSWYLFKPSVIEYLQLLQAEI